MEREILKNPGLKVYPLAIIGGGSAGVMAVLRSVLNNDETLFFPGAPKDKKRSRAFWVSKIENMPAHFHYSKGIEDPGRETLGWIVKSPFSSRLHWLKNCGVVKIEKTSQGYFKLIDNKKREYYAKYVILATGVMDVQPHIGGGIDAILPFANVQLADYCLRCDGHHVLNKHAGVIGHTSGAAWVALMLHERYGPPSFTVFTHGEAAKFDEEVSRLLAAYKIKIETEEIWPLREMPRQNAWMACAWREEGLSHWISVLFPWA